MLRGSKLGEGTFGIVYAATSPNTKKPYAVKRNLIDDGMSFMGAIREVDLLQKLRHHPYIVRLERVTFDNPFKTGVFSPLRGAQRKHNKDDTIHFIFGKASKDMYKYIYGRNEVRDFTLSKRYMTQLLLSLDFLHDCHIIHRDLKPGNILIFTEDSDVFGTSNIAKICDLGLAKPYTYQGIQTPSTVTSWYRAPEITLGYPHYDYKVDVWAMGCIFFEIIARKPFIGTVDDDDDLILTAILRHLPTELPLRTLRELVKSNKWRQVRLRKHNPKQRLNLLDHLGLSAEGIKLFEQNLGDINIFIDLLQHMLEFDWGNRWNVKQCLNHPFFNDCQDLITRTREMYPTTDILCEEKITIKNCIERRWMAQLVTNIFNDRQKSSWYNTRALFQSMDLFDRYLCAMFDNTIIPSNAIESDIKGLIHTKFDTELRFFTCLYLCIKYFSSIHLPISFDEIVPSDYCTPEAKQLAEQFEGGFIKNCLACNIYRPTLYESADHFEDKLDDITIRDLIILYTQNSSIHGLLPREVYRYYRTTLSSNIKATGNLQILLEPFTLTPL